MNKWFRIVFLTVFAAVSAVFSEGLIDGGFEATGTLGATPISALTNDVSYYKANTLYHQTDIDTNGVSVLDQGWFSGSTARHSQQGTTDKYCQFASNARWDTATRFWVGQIFTDTILTSTQTVSFDVVDANFTAADDSQRLVVEVYAWTLDALNTRISLGDSVAVNVTLLGSQQVDISGGMGTYTTSEFDFTSDADIYGIRLTTYSSNGTAAVTGALGIDNISISTNTPAPPEPPPASSVDLVDGGFEAVGALGDTPMNTDTNGVATQASSLYNQTGIPGAVTALDQGWYSGNITEITQQGTTDKYAEFSPYSGWDKDDRWWIGQMFTSTNATGEHVMSFDVVVDDYVDENTQTLEVAVYTVPNPTANNAKLKLNDDISSFTLLGMQTVDISAGNGSYTTEAIDFTADSDLYAIAIQVYSKDASNTLVGVSDALGLDNIAFESAEEPPPTTNTASAAILSILPVSDSVLALTVSSDNPSICWPKAASNLTAGTVWTAVGHSDDGSAPFVVTNLTYSTADGTNFTIYVEADADQKFFDIGAE